MKNAVFWDVMPCASCKSRSFGGTGELGTTLAVTSNRILVTLMKEAISSSETSVIASRSPMH
jgi:hypothetical protein